jgi:hypothetical protein
MTTQHDDADGAPDWVQVAQRNSRSVQTTIGWIFWDPGAVRRYAQVGLPEDFAGPLGYIGARSAPLAAAGPDAVIAAFGTISELGIRAVFDLVAGIDAASGGPDDQGDTAGGFAQLWAARDAAVLEGLAEYAPDIQAPLAELGPELWPVVRQLPMVGRTFFGAHLAMPVPDDPVLSGWHAVNCLREWRGDTHWALVVAAGLDQAEASILHNAWLGYEPDWLGLSRGTPQELLDAGWASLEDKGLAAERAVLPAGLALRQRIEDDTDRLTTLPWELLGAERSQWFAETFEPPCELLLARVDETAGPNYQPASRIR